MLVFLPPMMIDGSCPLPQKIAVGAPRRRLIAFLSSLQLSDVGDSALLRKTASAMRLESAPAGS